MARPSSSRSVRPAPAARRAAPALGPRTLLAALVVASLSLLGACGGSDDAAQGTTPDTDASAEQSQAEAGDADAGSDGGGTADPAEVQACLAEAGFETEASSDMLSEQQVADQLTAFGQTESLTFDATTNAFAGGVSFYESPEQATERAETLADAAKAQRVVGNALINVEAGSDFDDAVAAAETCLEG